jgi:hypothetical protein
LEDSDGSDSDAGLEDSSESSHDARPVTKSRSVPSSGKVKRDTKPTDKGRAGNSRKPSSQPHDASTSRADAARNAIMPKGGNKLAMLPSPILSLKNTYLATIFNALDASEAPFDDFTKTSPHFLKISRQAFQSVYPHLNVTIETDDVLFNVVSLLSFMRSSLSSAYRATSVLLNDEARFMRW